MRVAVIGAEGQLGHDVRNEFEQAGHDVRGLTHAEIEIADPESVARVLEETGPDLVVNTAAMHHVERCESCPEQAYAVNALGPRNLAVRCRELRAALVHVSTDYVFDGVKRAPYVETDQPSPLNVYGNSKLAGEYYVRTVLERHFVVRTSGLYGKRPCRAKGANFVELMLRLARERGQVRVVDTEVLTPTSTQEVAAQIVRLAATDRYGLVHATAEGSCSWYEFAAEIFAQAEVDADLQIAGPDEFPSKVPRPHYSVLENAVLEQAGLNLFRPWQDGLRAYLQTPVPA